MPALLVARLLDLDEVAYLVESALGGRVALVPLEDPRSRIVLPFSERTVREIAMRRGGGSRNAQCISTVWGL